MKIDTKSKEINEQINEQQYVIKLTNKSINQQITL